LRKIGRSGLLPAGAIITGGAAQIPMITDVAKQMLKIPAKIGFVEFPQQSTKTGVAISKDQRLLIAYGTANGIIDRVSTKPTRHTQDDHDGFIATIKNFLKQLMP
jgi:cell division ATPase FtsA